MAMRALGRSVVRSFSVLGDATGSEGGQIDLRGAGTNRTATIDLYNEQVRLFASDGGYATLDNGGVLSAPQVKDGANRVWSPTNPPVGDLASANGQHLAPPGNTLNAAFRSGYYNAAGMTGAPDGNWWFVQNMVHAGSTIPGGTNYYAKQIATTMNAGGNIETYSRRVINASPTVAGNWSAWERIDAGGSMGILAQLSTGWVYPLTTTAQTTRFSDTTAAVVFTAKGPVAECEWSVLNTATAYGGTGMISFRIEQQEAADQLANAVDTHTGARATYQGSGSPAFSRIAPIFSLTAGASYTVRLVATSSSQGYTSSTGMLQGVQMIVRG